MRLLKRKQKINKDIREEESTVKYKAIYNRDFFESPEESGLTSLENVKELPVLLRFLDPKPDEKVLDIGCGLGRFEGIIAERGPEVTGVDVSEYAIEQAKRRHRDSNRIQFICLNALEMDYENYFDKILCYHVIEHITLADGRILLRRIYNALKPGGVLVMGSPINDFALFRRLVRFIATGRQRSRSTHITGFSMKEIERELTSAGFHITDVCPLSYSGIMLPERLCRVPFIRQMVLCADIRAIKK